MKKDLGNKQLRILVVDDKEKHRQSARETLASHNLVVVGTFGEAIKQLTTGADYDVVLTDMMMPVEPFGAREQIDPDERRSSVPYGFIVALTAAYHGAEYVAVVTDVNHHRSAMSAALDLLGASYFNDGPLAPGEKSPDKTFIINGAKAVFVHAPFVYDVVERDHDCNNCKASGTCRFCDGKSIRDDGKPCWACVKDQPPELHGKCCSCSGTGKYDIKKESDRKDWGRVLRFLLKR